MPDSDSPQESSTAEPNAQSEDAVRSKDDERSNDRTSGFVGSDAFWHIAAAVVFLLATATLFHIMIGEDWRRQSVAMVVDTVERGLGDWRELNLSDLRFVAALLAQNAKALLTSPNELFSLGQCYPHPNALALGEPLIAPAILGLPMVPFGDPVLLYNFILLVSTLLAAFSMYWLIRDWTGVPAAGIAAGLLYGFHTIRMRDPVHFFVWDNAWTILALIFARRLFAEPRWRDAIALSACIAMQITGSFYPALTAAVVSIPMLVWLVAAYGIKKLQPAQLALVVGSVLVVAWVVFSPYLSLRTGGELGAREAHLFMPLEWLLPNTMFFPGLVVYGLAALGIASQRGLDGQKLKSSPRWALLAAGLLCLALATGGTLEGGWMPPPDPGADAPFNFWWLLAEVVPGLEVVRSPAALVSGIHTVLCILAGLGAAALIRSVPQRRALVAAVVVIGIAWLDVLRPESLGLTPRQQYYLAEVRPPDAQLEFFERLEAMGNAGPLYEITFPRRVNKKTTEPLLLGAYHGRPTSVCYNSFVVSDAADLWSEVHDPRALQTLRGMGFTTLVVHRPRSSEEGRELMARIARLRRETGDRYLVRLLEGKGLRAWTITGAPPTGDWRSDRVADPGSGRPAPRPRAAP